jgi:hypothetical protein
VATLLSLANQTIPVGTQTFGPYSTPTGQCFSALLTPTTWPASGVVFTFTIQWNDGSVFNGSALGQATLPKLKDGTTTGWQVRMQADGKQNAEIIVNVNQTFNTAILITSP